ncbi:MAG: threonine/serine exporter family protein [Pseudomonadota bacterium]
MTALRDNFIDKRSLDNVLFSPERSEPIGFILRLAKALHTYGVPAYELEKIISLVASRLGFGIQCMSLPTSISLTFMHEDNEYQTFVTRVAPGEINLEKLRRVTQTAQSVIDKEISPKDGAKQLKQVEQLAENFGGLVLMLAVACFSAALARILGGGVTEIWVSALAGLSLGALINLTKYFLFLGSVLPTIAAFSVSVISFGLANFLGGFATSITIVAGLIVLLPGLTLTIAMAELATQNLVSGTARLTGSGIVFLQLGLGLLLGNTFREMIGWEMMSFEVNPLPEVSQWIALIIASGALIVPFNARLKDAGWMIIAGVVAFGTSTFMNFYTAPSSAAFVGAIAVGITARWVNKQFSIPGAFILLPGILLLVPGSIGFRSIQSLVDHQVVDAFETAFEMAIIGLSLVSGLLISSMTRFQPIKT